MRKLISKLIGIFRNPVWDNPRRFKTVARNKSGVIIGAIDGHPLIDSSMSPVAVLGPCRSGKGVSILVPTLLTWRESAVVLDVQGELYNLTGHWRRTGANNEVRRLAFGELDSADTFNLLDAIPRDTADELLEIQALAADLLDNGQDGGGFWGYRARSLLTLFIIAQRRNLGSSLGEVQRAMADDPVFQATLATYSTLIPDNELGHAARTAATEYMELSETTRASVRNVVGDRLAFFASPDVARNTRCSSFDLSALCGGKTPMTIYVTVAARDIGRLLPLLRSFLALVIRHGTVPHAQEATHPLLLVLDELTALGRLRFLESALAYLPSYGIKPLLAIQSLPQLNGVYGKENRVWAQCAIRTVLPIRDSATASTIAEEIASIVAQSDQAGAERRQTISADKLRSLGKRDAVILGASAKPMLAQMLPYFEDPSFKVSVSSGNPEQPGRVES
ncbi:type IV secretory system conjugative DNA transfer family protein [Variovorax sp. VaC1]|uniref:type IV secretory system conjugative DNA transfer family protein n=1 Tax=Variovorax sp. VaC1 TaxID=3373132 RepID=UPI00374A95FE